MFFVILYYFVLLKKILINVFVEKGHSTKVLEKDTKECINNINCRKERETDN